MTAGWRSHVSRGCECSDCGTDIAPGADYWVWWSGPGVSNADGQLCSPCAEGRERAAQEAEAAEEVTEPDWTASFKPRPRLKAVVAAVLVVMAVVVFTASSPGAGVCPSGLSYDPSGLVETCDHPNGSTACVLTAFGFTRPQRTGLGPWCRP